MANSVVKISLESNQYERGIRQAQKFWNDFMKGIGLSVSKFTAVGAAIGAVTGALKVAKDAFFASETSLDEWGRTVQSSQSLYQGFLSALNNSDISGFLSRMDEIVSAARDAYNAMDELGTFSAFQQRNVAKGRAGYAQALDEYRLNPTADNKQKLQQANQKVMNDLRESHDKTEAAYQAALRQIATERISGKGMQDAFVKMFSEGNYGDLQAAKSSYKTGRGLNSGAQYYYGDRVYDGRVQDRTTGKWRDMSATEKQQFEFARALSQVNDSQIKEVQALGAQSVAITEQIYQQDRAYNRLAGNNAPLRSGSGSIGRRGRSGRSGSSKGFDISSIAFDPNKAMLAAVKGTGEDGPSEVWKAITEGAKEATSEVDNLTAAFEKLNKVQGVTAKDADNDSGNLADNWRNAGTAIGAVGDAMSQIEDPSAKVMGTIAQAIATIALTFASSLKGTFTPWDWIAAVATGTATMISTIAAIHSATGYAEGGMIKGNSYSGDNIGGLVDGSQLVGLNAGEVVLNAAQQNMLAQNLQGAGSTVNVVGRVVGEDIFLSADRYARRSGRGSILTGKNL